MSTQPASQCAKMAMIEENRKLRTKTDAKEKEKKLVP